MHDADTHTPSPGRDPDASLAAVLADVHVAIARAADEVDLMAALALILARRAPARCELCLIFSDDHGAPLTFETAAAWVDGAATREPPRRIPVSAAPLASRWLAAADQVLELPDLDADPTLSAADRHALAPFAAVTIVPLHSHRHQRWLGCIRVLWRAPHQVTPEDRFVDRLLMQTVAATIASRRTLHDHAAALAETRTLHAAHARLHAAASFAELLAVVAEQAGAHQASAAWLARVDPDDARAPGWLEILATWGDAAVPVGGRFHVPALARRPRQGEYDQFIADLEHEPDLDPGVRQLGETFKLRAAVTLPLRWRGRFTGMIILGWTDAHLFTPSERRLHAALARQAAVGFDSRLLLEQTRATLHEHQRQRATLETLLDNLPVGVVVHAVARDEPTLINRQAQRLADDLRGRTMLYPGTDTPMPGNRWPIARALHGGQLVAGEAELLADDGGRRTIESVAAPVHDEHGVMTHVIAVSTEVTERRRAEAERLHMQESLIQAQAQALAERSTPLLPISDEILVMPVVGTIDDGRGQQIMETLVGLGGHPRVRVAILDVTGAGTLDARGAHALVSAARALRLRGALPVLTGFSAGAARLLTAQGVDLDGLVIRGTLQAGIAHARALAARR